MTSVTGWDFCRHVSTVECDAEVFLQIGNRPRLLHGTVCMHAHCAVGPVNRSLDGGGGSTDGRAALECVLCRPVMS